MQGSKQAVSRDEHSLFQNLQQQQLKTRLRAISLRNAPTTCICLHVTKGTSDDDNNNTCTVVHAP